MTRPIPSFALAIALLGWPASVCAQTAALQPERRGVLDDWGGRFEISIAPRLGKEQPFESSEELVDESEGEVSLSVRRPNTVGRLPLQLKTGITHSPQYVDEADPQSAYYGEVSVGDSYLSLREFALRHSGERAGDVEDGMRPYARYRFARVYEDFFDSWRRNDHRLAVGVRYRDVRTIMCEVAAPAASEAGACSNVPGVSWEARGEVNRIWSSDPAEERLAPSGRLSVYSRPMWGGLRAYGEADLEARFYDSVRIAPGGRKREDLRLRLTAGVDLTPLVGRAVPGMGFTLAGQFQRRWSNEDGRGHSRFYFIPTITWGRSF